ncbi:hypothetical protein F7Q99_01125 [Streptomyces kaniharaensis]|uniref:Uncharacterized protein n=1 Tax=Streptomyces kaniharaensis TaxID=212423 RepID=A0A6N7KHR6_9ACTN|nr:hypothetical protein [Streptomyces kaniharaensis]MQS10916.1 hypothetical protein [Streptomyces kaniharaensis]
MELIRRAPLSFVGTVTRIGGTSLVAVPADLKEEYTAVVKVNEVLHAPDDFRQLAGSEVTVQLASSLEVGDTRAFFTQGMVYGESLGLIELERLPAEAVQRHVSMAATTADEMPFSALQREIRDQDIAQHAEDADAVVVGAVGGLEEVGLAAFSEHDPQWWRAKIDVSIVERGDVAPGRIDVLYPSSADRRWHRVPKPQPGQEGLWFLHVTGGDLHAEAPFQLLHPYDYQPMQKLAVLQGRR